MGRLSSIMCYTCTTIDADRLLSDLYDATWRRWLQNVRFVPKTQQCDDFFVPELALRSGTRSHACDDGVCMKMWFKEISGPETVTFGGVVYQMLTNMSDPIVRGYQAVKLFRVALNVRVTVKKTFGQKD
ncbi:unnamed protein product [Toxocara canis]|uniref:START domain-containing protein n=1 Tax=Toxocara canis TaxID=6265 RepID=A0A183V585_TOXCA|nr:unnamed protein product [Toxocara canis]